MNERPSFYPKHLAKQYVSTSRCSIRSNSESKSRETSPVKDAKMSNRREIFAPKMTSSTINLPARKNNFNEENISRNENRPQSKVLSGFPESFVDGMRTIFSLMDTKNEDKVKFEDIVTWWSTNEGDQNLPEGVVASLSKVATTEGYLTFERFCAGIKIAILRQEAAERKKRELNNNYEQSNSTTADASCPVITASQSSTACSSSATSSSLYQSSTGGSNMSQGTTGYSNMSQSSTGCSSMSTASAVTTDNSVFEEEPAPRPVSYQSPISPIQRKTKFGSNHFANSPLSRTSSLPSLPGALRAVDIPDQEAETASKRDERYNTPSPVPSEPWGGKAFQQEEEERRKILEGPPKPPRDPNRLSGIFYRGSTNSLPASSQTGQYPNISSYIQVNPTEQPIQFIWKSPPPEMRIPSLVHQQHQQLQQQHQLQQQQQQQHQLQQQQHIQQQQHYQIQQQQHHHLQQQQHIQHLQQHHPQQHQQQHFSIVVDENTQRTNEVQDIVVLRKPGSFRGVHSRNVRRHPSGSDTVSLKCTKMLEEEKMVLEEGLSVLERAQAIYRERLQLVELNLAQGPQRHLETVPVQLEAAQERVMFELKNIRDLNQRLGGIMKSAKPPNQQDRPRAPSQTRCHPEAQDQTSQDPNCDRRILRLQEQNRMLTDEVGRKSQAIFELEQEKRSLIRQLFQQTSTLCGSTDTIKNQNSKPNDHQQQPTAFNQNHFKKLDNEIKKLCIQ